MYFVYVDWTTEKIPRPFYVGKGKIGRVKSLLRNRHHSNIASAYGICRKVVFETTNEAAAFASECKLIAEHKTFVYDENGWGANYTRGGEGTSGAKFIWSKERRAHASAIQKLSFQQPSRIKIHIEATKKQWHDENRRLKQKERMIYANPSHSHPDTEKTRVKKSEGQRRRYENPDERKRMSELTKASCANPDVFKKRCKAQKLRRERERHERNEK